MIKENFKVFPLADFGSSEPWVARTWMSFKEFIDRLHLTKVEKAKVDLAFNDLFDSLSLAFISLRNIEKNSKDINIPLFTLRKEFFDFYDKLWLSFKDRFQKAIRELGFDIGFLFQNEKKFNEGLKKFSLIYNVSDDFQEMIQNDREWQNKLKTLRNDYIEHKTLSDEIEKDFFSLQHAKAYFHNTWTLIEDITILLMSHRLPNILMFQKIEESKRNKAVPKLYEIIINPEFMQN